jgi:hypothetical protein
MDTPLTEIIDDTTAGKTVTGGTVDFTASRGGVPLRARQEITAPF